jgi:hypothetical protein
MRKLATYLRMFVFLVKVNDLGNLCGLRFICRRIANKRSNLNSLSRLSGKLNPAEQGGHFKYNFIQAAYIGFKNPAPQEMLCSICNTAPKYFFSTSNYQLQKSTLEDEKLCINVRLIKECLYFWSK